MLHLIFEKIKMIQSYNTNQRNPALFNVNDGAVLRTFTHHTWSVISLALLPDGRRFVSASHDKTVRIVEHGLVL